MTDIEKKTVEKLRAEGYSYNMISKTLGISLSTVKSHIRRKTKIEPHPQTDSPIFISFNLSSMLVFKLTSANCVSIL